MRELLLERFDLELKEILDVARFPYGLKSIPSGGIIREKIVIDVPGFSKDDLKIEVDSDGYLNIKGEKKIEGEIRKINRKYFTLPYVNQIDLEKIEARVENGVLVINFSKKENKKIPREIPIK